MLCHIPRLIFSLTPGSATQNVGRAGESGVCVRLAHTKVKDSEIGEEILFSS